MILERFVMDGLRVAALLGITLAMMPLLRRASSATRRLVLALALTGALVLPAVSAIVPAWRVEAPAAVRELRGIVVSEPLAPGANVPAVKADDVQHANAPAAEASRVGLALPLMALWPFGALAVIARLAVGLVRARRMARRAAHSPSWASAMARAARATGLRADVRVTRDLDAPAVTGVLSPVILVPHGSEAWSEDRKHSVLLHELAHVGQRDCLFQIVAQLACAAHWFDPLAWLALRRFRIERELAADDAVIGAGACASLYAEDLLAIAEGASLRAPQGALGMAGRSQIAARIVAIVSPDRARGLPARRAAILGAGVACAVLGIACATPSASPTLAAAAPTPATAPAPTPMGAGSTIDPKIQSIADDELDRAMSEWRAAAGVVVVLEPSTGAILANAGRAHGAHADVGVKSAYITGSTLKAVTLTAALDEGLIRQDETFDCGNGAFMYQGKVIHDAASNGVLTVPQMLAVSTNIGFTKIYDRVGGERLGRWLHAFHFGEAPPVEGAIAGFVPARIEDKSFDGAIVAIGEKVAASPLQIAAAYAAFANGGVYVAPTLTRRSGEAPRETIMKPATARAVVTMLEGVVNDEHATGKLARVAGTRVAGKTGTAAWELPNGGEGVYASFVGFFPSDAPRAVIVVGLEQPREGGNGPSAAAPLFARVASRIATGS